MDQKECNLCTSQGNFVSLYGYHLCENCREGLRLYSDRTIRKHAESYARKADIDNSLSYEEATANRLAEIEKDYIKVRIKLLHILERLAELQ